MPIVYMSTLVFIRKFNTALPLITALLCLTSLLTFAQRSELVVQTGHSKSIYKTSISPDGRLLASLDTWGNVLVWDIQTGNQLRELTCLEGSLQIAFNSNTSLVGLREQGEVKVCSIIDGTITSSLPNPDHHLGEAFLTQDGKVLALTSGNYIGEFYAEESVEVLNLQTKETV